MDTTVVKISEIPEDIGETEVFRHYTLFNSCKYDTRSTRKACASEGSHRNYDIFWGIVNCFQFLTLTET